MVTHDACVITPGAWHDNVPVGTKFVPILRNANSLALCIDHGVLQLCAPPISSLHHLQHRRPLYCLEQHHHHVDAETNIKTLPPPTLPKLSFSCCHACQVPLAMIPHCGRPRAWRRSTPCHTRPRCQWSWALCSFHTLSTVCSKGCSLETP